LPVTLFLLIAVGCGGSDGGVEAHPRREIAAN